MGSSDSKLSSPSSCKEIRKWPHSLLGNLVELQNQQGQTFFLKNKFHADQHSHKQALQKLKQRKINKHLLQVERVQERQVEQFCGSSYRIEILLEPFHYDLQYVYNKKTIAKQPFSEDELIEILVACVNGLLFIQDNDLKKYHLNKQSIVYSGRDIKILDGGIVDKCHPFFSIMAKQKIQKDIFLAPQLLQDLNDNLQPYLAPKTDIFTIGMLLLHLASLEPLDYLYDYNTYSLNFLEIQNKIKKLKYSEFFKQVLRATLHEQEQERLGLISVQDMLGINSRRQTVRLDTYRSHKNNSFRDKQTSKTQSHDQSLHLSKEDILRSQKDLPNILQESQINSSIINKSLQNKKSKIFLKQSVNYKTQQNKENETTPAQKLNSNLYKLAHSVQQSPISRLDIQASPILNQMYERIIFDNGSFYQGQVSSTGLMQGNGILHYASGKVAYSGSWQEGQFSGFGTLHNEHPKKITQQFDYSNLRELDSYWIRYQGQFQNDCRHGFGTIFLTNGQKFSGCFKNDVIDGYGTYHFNNGEQINAVWRQSVIQN